MCDEDKIGFHVYINCFYNETAHYADIVLPWTTYLERWDLDARGSYNLRPYVGLRTPVVKPLGEARDIRDFFPDIAKRVGGGMEKAYEYSNLMDLEAEIDELKEANETQRQEVRMLRRKLYELENQEDEVAR